MDIGLLLLRVTVGLTLAAHGGQKLFGWFGGPGLDGTAQGMAMLGFRPGKRHAALAGLAELVGGALLAVGLFTPLAAAIALVLMIVAAVAVHLRKGFFLSSGGYEYNLVLGVAGLALAFTGPGSLSLDAIGGWVVAGPSWGAVALVAGVLGATGQLIQRRVEPAPVPTP